MIAIEFIEADENAAVTIADASLESGEYRYFRCLELDIAALGELYFLLKGQPYSENYLREFSVLFRSRNNKTLVLRMPQSLVQTLAQFDGPISAVAVRWREKAGIVLNEWHDEYRRKVIANLHELAQRAHARKSCILLRVNV